MERGTVAKHNDGNVPVWVYVIFRKNLSSGHEKVTINTSTDGPVFWDRTVIYAFCCSCHFFKHETSRFWPFLSYKSGTTVSVSHFSTTQTNPIQKTTEQRTHEITELLNLLGEKAKRIERVCLVDKPVDYPFLPDSFFSFMANSLPNLQFVYLRELDLERINRGTVEKLSKHRALKKLIVHGCRNYDVFQDFRGLPQLLVVKGEIIGLKQMLGDVDIEQNGSSLGSAGASEKSSSSYNGSRLSSEESQRRMHHSPSPIAVTDR
ncbi:hypothetical protein M3Y97_00224500 [Aphelenchoides bicaudatus]|nr:hypothetical protein M3Y97_00224500 [Aphelenchoides bicaudatus]